MLHAINQNQTKFYERYLGYRQKDEKMVREEDEITSLIFSPLSFLPYQAISKFWSEVVSVSGVSELPIGTIENAEMYFWPTKERITPDMIVILKDSNGAEINLLIEFKWRAPLSGKDQLHKQWKVFFQISRNEIWHTIFSLRLM